MIKDNDKFFHVKQLCIYCVENSLIHELPRKETVMGKFITADLVHDVSFVGDNALTTAKLVEFMKRIPDVTITGIAYHEDVLSKLQHVNVSFTFNNFDKSQEFIYFKEEYLAYATNTRMERLKSNAVYQYIFGENSDPEIRKNISSITDSSTRGRDLGSCAIGLENSGINYGRLFDIAKNSMNANMGLPNFLNWSDNNYLLRLNFYNTLDHHAFMTLMNKEHSRLYNGIR